LLLPVRPIGERAETFTASRRMELWANIDCYINFSAMALSQDADRQHNMTHRPENIRHRPEILTI